MQELQRSPSRHSKRERKGSSSSRKTSDEKITECRKRRALRKAVKTAKKLKADSVSEYSNESNPFSDPNLNEKFVWKKKIEHDIPECIPLELFSLKAQKKRDLERMAEIEKVRKRRRERVLEKAWREEEMAGSFSPEPIMEKTDEPEEEDEGGSFSPQMLHGKDNEEAIDPEEDRALLKRKRMAVKEEHQRPIQEAMKVSKLPPAEEVVNFEMKAMKAMGVMEEGDAVFDSGAEVNLDSQEYWWHDKYRPRKPKYFNQVHTGYEWNKYNQTHYDHDNPPPKRVQGYKFNIFYPDLVDKVKGPTYTIEKDGNSEETCIIRFHAGPPYEDIAFRIVNHEWEYSHKKGCKCTFERGILHLYFNFTRYRYRR